MLIIYKVVLTRDHPKRHVIKYDYKFKTRPFNP